MTLRLITMMILSISLTNTAYAQTNGDKTMISPDAWLYPLNEISQVACHNCFEHRFTTAKGSFSTVLNDIKTLEIDFWDQKTLFLGGQPKAWYVRHDANFLGFFNSGNDNSCSGDGNGTNDLRACLKDVKRWSDDHSDHFPIIIMLDKKQSWSHVQGSDRKPANLDDLVRDAFKEALFAPKDLFAFAEPEKPLDKDGDTLQARVKVKGWPRPSDLKGRILVVLNGSDVLNVGLSVASQILNILVKTSFKVDDCVMNQYLDEQGLNAAMFVAPNLSTEAEVNGKSGCISAKNAKFVVMNNMDASHKHLSGKAYNEKHLTRVWGNDHEAFSAQVASKTGLATYDRYLAQKKASYRIVHIPPETPVSE
ncbi:Ca2+-dependent phosphoinositide-specific phospholipase C [Phyllobacterium brassicacearum]|nr:Ca2+-dependent phosphoinositide-specific phospholipase C [Phyllobacterium brassicacearum]TDQ30487.1 calcium-dependent phosphoinositide phospholipase C [Phyllobacterium brassicacearum]